MGIAAARFTVGALIFTPLLLFVMMRLCRISTKDLLSTASPSLFVAAATAAAVMAFSATSFSNQLKPVIQLLFDIALGGLATVGTLIVLGVEILGTNIRALISNAFIANE